MAGFSKGGLRQSIRRIIVGALLVLSFFLFVLWRIDNPKLQYLRVAMLDFSAPALSFISEKTHIAAQWLDDLHSFIDLRAENIRLRHQVEQLQHWQNKVQILEQENRSLRMLNKVKLPIQTPFVTAEVIGDAGGPYLQSVAVNTGLMDGVEEGAAVLDAHGLVGRIAGIGEHSARVLLLSDPDSQIPVFVGPVQVRAILDGKRRAQPVLKHLPQDVQLSPGMQVVTSGEGGILPQGIMVGHLVANQQQGLQVNLAADLLRLRFVRIFRRYHAIDSLEAIETVYQSKKIINIDDYGP